MAKTWVYEDIKESLEGGYSTRPEEFNGVVCHNYADDSVDVYFDHVNPAVARAYEETFHDSVLQQMKSQTVAGKGYVIIFQSDSRSPGAASRGNEELEKSFMFFHNSSKYGVHLWVFLYSSTRTISLL